MKSLEKWLKETRCEDLRLDQDKKEGFLTSVYQWNLRNPFDYYIRRKYNIRFGSKEHRETVLLSSLWEYMEERIFIQAFSEKENKVSKKDLEMIQNLDLSTFNDR